jgi:ribose/xylose/arabinose/galactoside ABC-type transport system permease subunit
MKLLMITWTDIFNATGDFFQWIFKGMRVLGHGPNIVIWILIIGVLAYWTMRLSRYKKEAHRNGTIE